MEEALLANLRNNKPVSAAQQGSTQDPKRSWLVSPVYIRSCISCVFSQVHPNYQPLIYSSELITFFYQKNLTISKNIPPQQQFYPNHHVIQHPMVGVSQVIRMIC